MRVSANVLTVLLIASVLSTNSLDAQNVPVYQVVLEADPVRLDVAVSDSSGRAVENLAREQFEIYEDGVLQETGAVNPVGMPYSILLLVDRSPRETRNKWADFILKSVDLFLKNLRGPDRLAVAAFDTRVAVLVDWRPSRNGLVQRVMLRHSEQPTRFFEALDWAVEEMRYVSPGGGRPQGNGLRGRKGVIVFTDGRDRDMYPQIVRIRGEDIVDPNYTVPASVEERYQNTRRILEKGSLPFYFVVVDTDRQLSANAATARLPGWMRFLSEVRTRIEGLAVASAGRASFPRDIEDLLPLYEQIHRDLGSGYQVTYNPSRTADNKLRTIEVRIKDNPALTVLQSQNTYYAR
jgi:VWFA-related protein